MFDFGYNIIKYIWEFLMKKSLFLFIIILQFISIGLFGYDNSQLEQLLAGKKNLAKADFTNVMVVGRTFDGVDLTGADFTGAKFINVVFKNSKLDKVIFTEAKLFNVDFDNCTHKNMIILKTSGMNSETKKDIKEKGALIAAGSVMCQSDTHVRTKLPGPGKKRDFIKEKLKHAGTMLSVAKKKKNKLKGIIFAGDLVDRGAKKNWEKFKKHFISPFWEIIGRNKMFICKGNHDRFEPNNDRVGFSHENYSTKMIEKYCRWWAPKKGADYYSKKVDDLKLRVVSLSECPTRNENEALKWFEERANKKENMVVFSHYSPMHNFDWWSESDYPRENLIFKKERNLSKSEAIKYDKANGKKVIARFAERLGKYKNKIKVYVSGHLHETYIKYWKDILIVGVGGGNRFALLHFTADGVLVAVELFHHAGGRKVFRYYPNLFGLKKFY